ncbi:peptidoglycan-binding protein [Candidatus Cetobacterium colombiensis]|uniref:Peptidoglycan-binding protein n=1 Tax=Candidatus Cetobacterium colombiensis TaxID=3073100 RepID=A0ABU4WDK6_9FUSO|nr:peptidoglycan-binding protein [Candidatus Cetobacterium colombiensis]MDX8336804.1 peptidoglycan-binding protein [Candidatus Cetobacterium colombiensis]
MSFFKILEEIGNSISEKSKPEIQNELDDNIKNNEKQEKILEKELSNLNLKYHEVVNEFVQLKKSINDINKENNQLKKELDNFKNYDESIKNILEDNKILNLKNNDFQCEITKTRIEYLKLKKISTTGFLIILGVSIWFFNKNAKLENNIKTITSITKEEKISLDEFKNLQTEIQILKTKNDESINLNNKLLSLEKEVSDLKNTDNDINRKINILQNKNIITKNPTNNSQNLSTKKTTIKRYTQDDIYTRLLELGYRGNNAIANFQMRNGLNPTGIADQKTLFIMGLR